MCAGVVCVPGCSVNQSSSRMPPRAIKILTPRHNFQHTSHMITCRHVIRCLKLIVHVTTHFSYDCMWTCDQMPRIDTAHNYTSQLIRYMLTWNQVSQIYSTCNSHTSGFSVFHSHLWIFIFKASCHNIQPKTMMHPLLE